MSLLASVALAGLTAMLIGSTLNFATSSSKKLIEKGETEMDVATALETILRAGRLASSCVKLSMPTGIECTVDYGLPPVGNSTDVRTVRISLTTCAVGGSCLVHEVNGGRQEYRGIVAFDICAPADIQAGTCTLLPLALSANSSSNQYFRFRLTGVAKDSSRVIFQSGFVTRNPSAGGLVYQWGTRN